MFLYKFLMLIIITGSPIFAMELQAPLLTPDALVKTLVVERRIEFLDTFYKTVLNRVKEQVAERTLDEAALKIIIKDVIQAELGKLGKTESKRRSLCKAAGWRTIGFFTSIVQTLIVAAIFAQNVSYKSIMLTATLTALGDSAFKIAMQYLYERWWLGRSWGMHSAAEAEQGTVALTVNDVDEIEL